MAKYKNDYKPLADNCVYLRHPRTVISIGGDKTFMTDRFRYVPTSLTARVAIGFWYYDANGRATVYDLEEFAPGKVLRGGTEISNGPWIEGPTLFPPQVYDMSIAVQLMQASELKEKGASISLGDWTLTSLSDTELSSTIAKPSVISNSPTVISYAFATVSGNYGGNLASKNYEDHFGNTVRQTGAVPTDASEFETYLGQLGLSADAYNGVSGYISSSAYSAGIAPPGGRYIAYTNQYDSPLYSTSSFFSSGDVSFSYEYPCSTLVSINSANAIQFGYYTSFQGPTP